VPIDVHGSLDRAKDVSSSQDVGRSLGASRAKSACAWRTLTTFPSSFFQRTPVVAGATDCLGRAPNNRVGPTKAHISPATREGDRHPVDQGAFHRCDFGHVKGSLLFVSRVGLPLTPPTRCPHGWGQNAFRALQASLSERVRQQLRESRTPLQPRCADSCEFRFSRLGLTTQARQRGSV